MAMALGAAAVWPRVQASRAIKWSVVYVAWDRGFLPVHSLRKFTTELFLGKTNRSKLEHALSTTEDGPRSARERKAESVGGEFWGLCPWSCKKKIRIGVIKMKVLL